MDEPVRLGINIWCTIIFPTITARMVIYVVSSEEPFQFFSVKRRKERGAFTYDELGCLAGHTTIMYVRVASAPVCNVCSVAFKQKKNLHNCDSTHFY